MQEYNLEHCFIFGYTLMFKGHIQKSTDLLTRNSEFKCMFSFAVFISKHFPQNKF
jgi:hypothetical protein